MRRLKIKKVFASFLLSLTRYYSHRYLFFYRARWLKILGAKIGENVKIKAGVIIEYPENLEVGSKVSIQQNCFISAYDRITIGDDVSIAHNVSILTSSHPYNKDLVIRDSAITKSPVTIESNVWIGMKASILDGVTIGSGSVVGAHSLVTKNVNKNSVVAGAPAKFIKYRLDI